MNKNKKLLKKFINNYYETIYDVYVNCEGKDISLYICPDYIDYNDFHKFFELEVKKVHSLYINFQKLLGELNQVPYSEFVKVNKKQGITKHLDKKWRDYILNYLKNNFVFV